MKAAIIRLKKKKAALAAITLLLVFGIAFVVKTWPYNFIATAAYRLLGKTPPGNHKEDLQNIKLFLSAKRKVDSKQYAAARADLESLSSKVQVNFLFFKEIYFYLGYVYDVSGEFAREEELYSRLAKKDPTFYKFMFGLYNVRHGRNKEARQELFESLKLDDRHHRLGKYRQTAIQALQISSSDHSQPSAPPPRPTNKAVPENHQ